MAKMLADSNPQHTWVHQIRRHRCDCDKSRMFFSARGRSTIRQMNRAREKREWFQSEELR